MNRGSLALLALLPLLTQRSLTGRVIGTLLAAFVLVAAVLLGRDWFHYQQATRDMAQMREAAQSLVDVLPADTAGAVLVMHSSEQQYNALRRRTQAANGGPPLGDVVLLLQRAADGATVYRSAMAGSMPLPPQKAALMVVPLGATPHWAVQAARGPWQLRFLAPVLSTPTALQIMVADLAVPLLLAMPLVLLPLAWAVVRGLRPLRTLTAAVAQRRSDDFSPLSLDLRYAELQPLQLAFNTLLAQSRQAVERERAFVQDAAHELRTPLAVIAAQAHALGRAGPDSAAHQQAQHQLERAIARASHQVHQLLTLARLDGASQRAPQALDLVAELREALIGVAPQAQARGITLDLEAPEALSARLDRVAWQSVIDNLLHNAIHHGREGGHVQVSLQVRSGASQPGTPGPWLRLCVADDGPGLPEAERQRVFERFQRGTPAPSQAQAPGCGLGLSIVRQAARQMGGDVRLGTGLGGRGLACELHLPAEA